MHVYYIYKNMLGGAHSYIKHISSRVSRGICHGYLPMSLSPCHRYKEEECYGHKVNPNGGMQLVLQAANPPLGSAESPFQGWRNPDWE